MSDEKVLTKEIAEKFLADEYSVQLEEFTAIEDDAAKCLCTSDSRLDLGGLSTLSDAAAESLRQHQWELNLSGLKSLSDAAVEIITKHQKSDLCLSFLTELPDAVAEHLTKNHGKLYLDGLTTLPDTVADKLSEHRGRLFLNGLTALSDTAADLLSKHYDGLALSGLTELSDAAAKSLSKCDADLNLDGLTELSEQAARALATINTKWARLSLKGLTILQDTPGDLTIAEKLTQQSKDGVLYLPSLKEIGEEVARLFGKVKCGVELGLDSLDATVASALIKKRKSKDCMYEVTLNRIEHLTVEAARQLAKNKAPLILDGLVEIDDDVADALSKHADYLLSLNGLVEPTESVLGHLSKHAGPIHLNGIQSLSAKGAGSLAKCSGVEISLNDLRELPVEVAKNLRKYKGKKGERSWDCGSTTLFVNRVAALTDDAAFELSRYKGVLYLEGLAACNDGPGHVALAGRLAGQEDKEFVIDKDFLELNQLAEITPEFAAGISKHLGDGLELNGLAQLSTEAAGALGAFADCGFHKRQYKLSLNGLKSLSKGAAEQLVANPTNNRVGIDLHLNGLLELADDIAEILVSGFTSGLELNGLKVLSDATALSLAKYNGKEIHGRPSILSLHGLTSISDTAAEQLSKCQGTLWILIHNFPESAAAILRKHPSVR